MRQVIIHNYVGTRDAESEWLVNINQWGGAKIGWMLHRQIRIKAESQEEAKKLAEAQLSNVGKWAVGKIKPV